MPNDLARALGAGQAEAISRSFDAIVIGAGAAGGLAANLLCEAGLSVLLLDAGYTPSFWRKPVRRLTNALISSVADPRLMNVLPPRAINAGRRALRVVGRIRQPVQMKCFAWERLPQVFVDDRDFPYATPDTRPFHWIRAHALGGRMIVPGHGRQYYRLGMSDFSPSDALSPCWPVAKGELDPWYEVVEKRIGLAGNCDGLPSPPDSAITRSLRMTIDEERLANAIRKRWPASTPILSRYAPPLDTVGAAAATSRLWCRAGALVQSITQDADGRASGCIWYDVQSKRLLRSTAPIVFLCASTLESTRILLNSEKLNTKPGVLGHYLMDHMMVKAEGIGASLADTAAEIEPGRCLYLPRFDLRDGATSGRGYGVQLYQSQAGERSWFTAVAFCEVAPRPENRVTLDRTHGDIGDNPTLQIDYRYSEMDRRIADHMVVALEELADLAGVRLLNIDRAPAVPGTSVHECGTARMGADPATSILDPNNQCWDAPGLYVTDGASFPSQGAQNPTLTIMALTARACEHAQRSHFSQTNSAGRGRDVSAVERSSGRDVTTVG